MTLNEKQTTQLLRLKNRRTLYEIAIFRPDGEKALLCFTDNKSDGRVMDIMCERAAQVLQFTGAASFSMRRAIKPAFGIEMADGSMVQPTGRTKRDVIIEGTRLASINA